MRPVLTLAVSATLALATISSGLARQHVVRMQHTHTNHRVVEQVSPRWFGRAIRPMESPAGPVLNDYPHVFCCS